MVFPLCLGSLFWGIQQRAPRLIGLPGLRFVCGEFVQGPASIRISELGGLVDTYLPPPQGTDKYPGPEGQACSGTQCNW